MKNNWLEYKIGDRLFLKDKMKPYGTYWFLEYYKDGYGEKKCAMVKVARNAMFEREPKMPDVGKIAYYRAIDFNQLKQLSIKEAADE